MTDQFIRDAAIDTRTAYRLRDARMSWHDRKQNMYHPRHPVGRLFRRHNQDVLQTVLNRLDVELTSARVLDVGSGFGHWLRYLVELGADPLRLTGIDMTHARLESARHANPALNWVEGDGASLPFRDAAFDLVFQVVTLSSVLDERVHVRICSEMARVVALHGLVFWIDRARPEVGRLAGFTRADLTRLFPGFSIRLSRRVHPCYYRWLGGRLGQFCELAYKITTAGCESTLYVLQREGTGSESG